MKGVVVVGTDTEATGSLGEDGGSGGSESGGSEGGSGGSGGSDGGSGGSEGGGSEGGEGGSEGGDDGSGGSGLPAANTRALQTMLAMLVLGFLSPVLLLLILRARGGDDSDGDRFG